MRPGRHSGARAALCRGGLPGVAGRRFPCQSGWDRRADGGSAGRRPLTGESAISRPNILCIISDDHGYGDISWEGGNEDVHTPNLERLAARGVSFRQGYVSAPICSPSRRGLITGAYQQRWGGRWFDTSAFPPPERPTMPELLGQLGYRTGYFGKIHYGSSDDYGTRSCPDRHGFREAFYGLASLSMGGLHYMRHSEQDVVEYGPERAKVHGVQPMVHNGEKVDCHEHLTIEFARRAVDFMSDPGQGLGEGQQEDEERPFFCMVAFNAVHNFTWQLPQWKLDERGLPSHPEFDPDTSDYLDWYDGAIWPNLDHGREYYLGQLELMDAQIGRLLDHLEETGQIDNTLIVYLTDNGGSTCNFGNNAPLAGTKYTLHEGGVRVPYVIAGPDVKEPGSRSQALVSSLDLLPTFVAAAGVRCLRTSPSTGSTSARCFGGRVRRPTTSCSSTPVSSGRCGPRSGSCGGLAASPVRGARSSRSSTPTSARGGIFTP